MMTRKELAVFLEYTAKFDNECSRVKSILSGIKDRKHSTYGIEFADFFYIADAKTVYWWRKYDEHEHWTGSFDIELLMMTDDELSKFVDGINEEYEKEEKRKEAEVLENERRQYEELKKKFEK